MSSESPTPSSPFAGTKGLILGIALLAGLIYLPGRILGPNAMTYLLSLAKIGLIGGAAVILVRAPGPLRIALLAAFAFPGAGHFLIGEKKRGLFFMIGLPFLFLVGMFLTQWAAISLTRHPVWFAAQIPGGLMTLLGWAATSGVKITEANDLYLIGSVYVGAAGLLNLLACCDVWDRHPVRKTGAAPAAVAEGA